MPSDKHKRAKDWEIAQRARNAQVPDPFAEDLSRGPQADGPARLMSKVLSTGVPLNIEFEGKQYYFDRRWYDSQYRELSKRLSEKLYRELEDNFPHISESYRRTLETGPRTRKEDQEFEARAGEVE